MPLNPQHSPERSIITTLYTKNVDRREHWMNEVTWLKSASRSNESKCRHALKEKCTVAREQTEKGPGLSVQDRDDGSSSGKVQLSCHCGRGRSSVRLSSTATGCQYQVPHKQCHSASVTTPYLSPMLQRTVQEPSS